MAQPTERPEIQEFLAWLNSNCEYAILDPSAERRLTFVPLKTVDEHLHENSGTRLKEILTAIFSPGDIPVDVDDVLQNYVRIFCILVRIGKGNYIESFSSHDLSDRLLPFDPDHPPPAHFPLDSSGAQFYKAFCEEQWMFCAAEFKHPMTKMIFHEKRVLPIVSKEKIAGGGSAILYKIRLHSSYNTLYNTSDLQRNQTSDEPADTFALKTYITPDAAKYYANEVNAFQKLRGNRDSGLIGFYGSYVQGIQYNVILEYADRGTFEQYLQKTIPPVEAHQIINFWEGLFEIIKGLKCIHDAGAGENGPNEGPRVLHGFHQDVKPGNILMISGGNSSPYEWKFRLADLGISHFKRVVDNHGSPTANDSQGTRAYGAPECYRGDDYVAQNKIKITPNVDIWSLGCIFSEAAVWLAKGFSGVQEYRKSRGRETENILAFRDGNCFHDSSVVLRCVKKCHKDIIQRHLLRQCDYITADVLDMVDRNMLVSSDYRLNATQLWGHAQALIREAKHRLESSRANAMSSFGGQSGGQPSPLESPPSPHAPPRPTDPFQVPCRPEGERAYRRETSPQAPTVPFARFDYSPDRITPNEGSFDQYGRTVGVRNSPWPQTRYPGTRPSGSRASSSNLDKRSVDYYESSSSKHSQIDKDLANNFAEERQNANGHKEKRERYSHPNPTKNPTVLHQHRCEEDQTNFNLQQGRAPSRVSTFEGSITSVATARPRNSIVHSPQSSWQPPQVSTKAKFPESHEAEKKPPPYLSVAEAKQWKSQMKDRFNRHPPELRDAYLLQRLKSIDHAFLIDDASSMEPHWQEVKDLVGILAYLVKGCDPDGIDLFYTIASKQVKSNNSTALTKSIEKTKPTGVSNISIRLKSILEPYSMTLIQGSQLSTQTRPLNLYVLTDGVWQPSCDAEAPIRAMVKTLLRLGLDRTQVGIQFIRFGMDAKGKSRLDKLDSDLRIKNSEEQLDIVDTESSDGNVWKMLLGATDEWFDDDTKEAQDDTKDYEKAQQSRRY